MAHQLKKTIEQINEEYGENTIMELGDKTKLEVSYVKTGVGCVDKIIGEGIPQGRVTEFFGWEGCGKTTLALRVVAEVQKTGKPCAYIDAEHALDLGWCKKLGVNTDELIISQPDCAEQALDIVKRLIESEQLGVIVVDSIAALVPKSELEGEIGDASIGVQARLMSQTMRCITASLKRSNTVLIFINQIRMKIGVMFGNPETTCGGNALKFYASVRLNLTRKELIKDKKEVIGSCIKAKCVKNKVSSPFAECLFQIGFNGEITEAVIKEK